MKIVKAADAFDQYAKIYQDKFMDVSLFADTFNLFCDAIKNDHTDILDIACGPGNITKYLLDRQPHYNILGIDLSPNMLDLAQTNNPTASFQLMDCREIGQLDKKFDGIICGFCLPYLDREEAVNLITQVSGMINPGGLFYLSTMEDDYIKSRFQISSSGDQVYVNYHQEDYLTKAFQDHNFEILEVKRFTSRDKDDVVITDLVLTGKLV